jgi:hypothetical protein
MISPEDGFMGIRFVCLYMINYLPSYTKKLTSIGMDEPLQEKN